MTNTLSTATVLVTGASGFIAMHCVVQLLEQGYRVRGTLRSLAREPHLRQVFARQVAAADRLEFVAADLLEDAGWDEAVAGCDYVLHVASPFPIELPQDESDLIVPARQGTLRVLRAAAGSGVKRVVLTSSVAAILEGHDDYDKTFDESDWSNLDGPIGAYAKSKTLAEQAAWAFIDGPENSGQMELAVINPGFVLGPLLDGSHFGTSAETIRKYLAGEYPGTSRSSFTLVDVRDVAAAHIAAMTSPLAAGKRYCCVAEVCWLQEIAQILDRHFRERGYKVPTRQFPDFVVRLVALFDKPARQLLGNLGVQYRISNARIVRELDWQPRSAEEMVVAMGESLIEHGSV